LFSLGMGTRAIPEKAYSGEIETNFSGYCSYQEIGRLPYVWEFLLLWVWYA